MDNSWTGIHRRLEKVRAAMDRGFDPTPQEKKLILKKRAGVLAREPDIGAPDEDGFEVVEFMLSGEGYAFESVYVREVLPLKDLTPVPCTPPFVLGIINVRGQILSVVDIRQLFSLPQKGITGLNKVIVACAGDMETGILADDILGTRKIAHGQLKVLPTLTGVREDYLMGVTAERTAVLDAARLLSDGGLMVNEEV
ncbi:MAG: chemotaxis protein CheW [Bacillota bacterium]